MVRKFGIRLGQGSKRGFCYDEWARFGEPMMVGERRFCFREIEESRGGC